MDTVWSVTVMVCTVHGERGEDETDEYNKQ